MVFLLVLLLLLLLLLMVMLTLLFFIMKKSMTKAHSFTVGHLPRYKRGCVGVCDEDTHLSQTYLVVFWGEVTFQRVEDDGLTLEEGGE